jgi:hypothetical protein
MPTLRGIRFRLAQTLRNTADQLFVAPGGGSIRNIGLAQLGAAAPRALIVYAIHVIPYYVAGKLDSAPMLNEHSMYWESAEMVRQLNERGYVVDYYDVHCPEPIAWSRYALAFVQNERLAECPPELPLKKVFYCTENYWAFQNLAEMQRLRAFHARTGIWVRPERQTRVSFSDEYADYITLLGTPFQQQLYAPQAIRQQLDISVAAVPAHVPKDVVAARNNFLWLGSGGAILKGLDLAVEAFLAMPDAQLYIGGAIEREPRLWRWLKPLLSQHSNLHYMGWVDVTTAEFAKLANRCIATVYPSASEGGGGVVAQLLHFGLLPIVTETATVRGASLGFEIREQEPESIITAIQEHVRTVQAMSTEQLTRRTAACQAFAAAHHTRAAYAASFEALLDVLGG